MVVMGRGTSNRQTMFIVGIGITDIQVMVVMGRGTSNRHTMFIVGIGLQTSR